MPDLRSQSQGTGDNQATANSRCGDIPELKTPCALGTEARCHYAHYGLFPSWRQLGCCGWHLWVCLRNSQQSEIPWNTLLPYLSTHGQEAGILKWLWFKAKQNTTKNQIRGRKPSPKGQGPRSATWLSPAEPTTLSEPTTQSVGCSAGAQFFSTQPLSLKQLTCCLAFLSMMLKWWLFWC